MAETTRKEEYILDLIPRSQFHSCLLTTFSFDFNYFCHDVRSQLNRADIINTNVLVDDAMLQQYLGTMTGYAHDSVRRFAITGIPMPRGVFHPKLGLFFGDKEKGFMTIGSGNLTSCGHGKNQELWGAFHIEGPDDPKAPMFKAAWEFLRGFKDQMAGISRHKIEWIERYAGWISKISDTPSGTWISLDDDTSALLLFNSDAAIWNQVSAILEKETIEDVTVISPFFDAKGETLRSLCEIAGGADVHVIVQPESCSFPELSSFEVPRNLVFHDWNSIQTEESTRYVHSKLLHVKTTATEYCLIGSANLTAPGMGADGKAPVNKEASIFLRSKNDVLKSKLALDNRGAVIPVPETIARGNRIESIFSQASRLFRIKGVDRDDSILYVYMDHVSDLGDMELQLFDGWENLLSVNPLESAEYSNRNGCYKLAFEVEGEVFFARLVKTEGGEAVSNKVIVHDAKALQNTNPDPENKKLAKVIAQIEAGQTDLVALLRYIDPDDIVETARRSVKSGGGGDGNQDQGQPDGSGNRLDYEQFTRQGGDEDSDELGLYSRGGRSIDRIMELVKLLLQKAAERIADDQDEDEEAEKESLEGTDGRDDEDVDARKTDVPRQKMSAFRSNQRRIRSFFDKYIKTQKSLLDHKAAPTQLDHSLFAVALHLLIDFYKKPIMVEEKNSGTSKLHYLLDSQSDFFEKADFCRYVSEIVGQYSLLLTHGQKEVENPYEKRILDNIKRNAYWNAVCAIALITVNGMLGDKQETWIWELFMNLRHNCGVKDCGDRTQASEHLSALVNIVNTEHRDKSHARMMAFWRDHEKTYRRSQQASGSEKGLTLVGLRVFSPRWGFCHISSCEVSSDRHKIELSRPGYRPELEMQEFSTEKKFISEMIDLRKI